MQALPPDPRRLDRALIRDWADRHGVARLVLFGSAARGTMRPGSDVDLAFELLPGRQIGLFEQVAMRDELAAMMRASVDIGTFGSLKPAIRRQVDEEGITLHAASIPAELPADEKAG